MATTDINEARVVSFLRARYAPPDWAFMPQVRNQTGYARTTRTADALAMSLYPSRGLELHGFEVKVARGDLLKELREPAKAEEIARFCHRWWLVAPEGIATKADMPPGWGLLVLKQDKLVVSVPAPKLEPLPYSALFLAAVLRAAQLHVTDDKQVSERVAAAETAAFHRMQALRERTEASCRDRIAFAEKHVLELRQTIQRFEQTTGLVISQSRFGDVSSLAYLLASGNTYSLEYTMAEIERLTAHLALRASKARQELEAAQRVIAQAPRVFTDGGGI